MYHVFCYMCLFWYSYVFIPVLPSTLSEVLNSPTPFIAGVHAKLESEIEDLLDVIIVDLDGGSLKIPECVKVPEISPSVMDNVKKALTMVSQLIIVFV